MVQSLSHFSPQNYLFFNNYRLPCWNVDADASRFIAVKSMFWMSWCWDITSVTGSTQFLVFNSSILPSDKCCISELFFELYNVIAFFGNLWITTVVIPELAGGCSSLFDKCSCSTSGSGFAPCSNNVNLPGMNNVKQEISYMIRWKKCLMKPSVCQLACERWCVGIRRWKLINCW